MMLYNVMLRYVMLYYISNIITQGQVSILNVGEKGVKIELNLNLKNR